MFKDGVSNWPRTLQIVTGAFLIALGSLVIVGWHINSRRLMQVIAISVPMHYNTAVCFLLCGIALVQHSFGFKRVTMLLGIIVSVFGALTLSQHLFNINLGIDKLIIKQFVPEPIPFQNRMAPNTAMCFTLCGVALLLISVRHPSKWRVISVGLLGSIVVTSGMAALIAYATGFHKNFPLALLTLMAVHAAVAFLLLGISLVASVWHEGKEQGSSARTFLPIFVGVAVATASVAIWQALIVNERAQIEREAKLEAASVKKQIDSHLQERILALVRMAKRWEKGGQPTKDDWEADASSYIKHSSGYQAIEWTDPSYHIRWVEPLAGNEAALNLDLSQYEGRKQVLDSARQTREAKVSPTISLVQGGKGFLLVIPIFRGEEFGGFILGVFRVQKLLDTILPEEVTRGYSIAVSEGNEEIYRRDVAETLESAKLKSSAEISFYGVKWNVQVRPGAQLLSEKRSFVPKASLGLGLLLSVLLGLSIHLSRESRLKAKEVETANQELKNEIAERRLIAAALIEKELQMRSVMESANDAIISADGKGNIISWNKSAEKIFGYTEEEALGQPLALLMPERFRALHREGLKRYLTTGETKVIGKTVELEGLRKDGNSFPLELSLGTWKVGEETFFSGIARDITERRSVEASLLFLASIVESSEDAIYGTSLEGEIISWNHGAEKIYGYTAEEAKGRIVSMLIPDEFKHEFLRIREGIRRGDKVVNYETIREGKDGKRIHVSLTVTPVKNADGQVVAGATIARDITEHKHMENELNRTNALVRTVIETTPDLIFVKDRDGRMLYANPAALKVIGKTSSELIGKNEFEWLGDPQESAALRAVDRRIMESEQTEQIEEVLTGLEGTHIYLSTKSPMRDDEGDVIGIIGIARDITERKRTEEKLRRISTLLQTISETTPDAIYVKDRDGRMLFANPATLQIIGKPAEDVLGKSEFDWHDDTEEAAAFRANDVRIMESGKTEIIEEVSTGPEGARFFLSTKSPMRDDEGEVIGIIGVSHNITRRKWAEDALKESEMRLQRLFESAPDAILVVNGEGKITRINAVTEKMFGYKRDELLGQPIEMLIPKPFKGQHVDHRARYHAKQSLREMGMGLDVYAERKDGSTFPVSVMLSPLSQDEAGDVIAIAHDITERKRAEEKISQSLIEKEALLKEIHHRVKNNMQVISSLISLQSNYITDPQALKTFEESQQRVQAMALIHEKLYRTQDLSRIDFAEYVNDLATSIFATYSVNAEAVALKINADRAFLKIQAAIPCSLIINELVTNSIKYAFPRGKQGEIYIGFHKEADDKHVLTIGDNGVGLPADLDIEKAETLGLRLVNILVHQLEGHLEVDNKNGTEFKISFQRADKDKG